MPLEHHFDASVVRGPNPEVNSAAGKDFGPHGQTTPGCGDSVARFADSLFHKLPRIAKVMPGGPSGTRLTLSRRTPRATVVPRQIVAFREHWRIGNRPQNGLLMLYEAVMGIMP
jgi:hypothetical protein